MHLVQLGTCFAASYGVLKSWMMGEGTLGLGQVIGHVGLASYVFGVDESLKYWRYQWGVAVSEFLRLVWYAALHNPRNCNTNHPQLVT